MRIYFSKDSVSIDGKEMEVIKKLGEVVDVDFDDRIAHVVTAANNIMMEAKS